jgi:hypothetical protein
MQTVLTKIYKGIYNQLNVMWLVNYGIVTYESQRKIQTCRQEISVDTQHMCKGKVTAPQASNKPCTISERCVLYKYKDFQHLPKCIADFVDNKKQFVKPLRSLLIEVFILLMNF